jgi:hypothetical protein
METEAERRAGHSKGVGKLPLSVEEALELQFPLPPQRLAIIASHVWTDEQDTPHAPQPLCCLCLAGCRKSIIRWRLDPLSVDNYEVVWKLIGVRCTWWEVLSKKIAAALDTKDQSLCLLSSTQQREHLIYYGLPMGGIDL